MSPAPTGAMPSYLLRPFRLRFLRGALAVASALVGVGLSGATPAQIAVLRSAAELPGDATRDGAGEFAVMMSVAQLGQQPGAVGIVGVGNRHGLFPKGGEHALRFFALRGIAVAKLTSGGDFAADPEGLFLEAGRLSERQASVVLARCLERYGAPPAAADPDHPTTRELEAIRAHLASFHQAFLIASGQQVAMK